MHRRLMLDWQLVNSGHLQIAFRRNTPYFARVIVCEKTAKIALRKTT
jgi:hypothetical protein